MSWRALRSVSQWDAMIYAGLLVAVAACWGPVLGIWAYGDDLAFLSRAAVPSQRWRVFAGSGHLFRWPERLINAVNVELLGPDTTLLSHCAALLAFVVTALLVLWVGRILQPSSKAGPVLAAFYYAVSPANGMSLTQIDTISAQLAAMFCLLLFYWHASQRHRSKSMRLLVSAALAFMAVSSKETAVGLVCTIPLAAALLSTPQRREEWRGALRDLAIDYAVVGAAVVAYLTLRAASGAPMGSLSGRYVMVLSPLAVARNIVQVVGSVLYLGSSLDVYPELRPLRIAISSCVTLLLAVPAAIGVYSVIRRRPGQPGCSCQVTKRPSALRVTTVLVLLSAASMFPVAVLPHMSELYAAGPAPYLTLLVGILAVRGFRTPRWSGAARPELPRWAWGSVCLAMLWLGYASHGKVMAARELSARARAYHEQVSVWLSGVGSDRVSLCWKAELSRTAATGYSGFKMADRGVLHGVVRYTAVLLSRNVAYFPDQAAAEPCDYLAFDRGSGLQLVAPEPEGGRLR